MATLTSDKAETVTAPGWLSIWLARAERRTSLASLLFGVMAALSLPPLYLLPGLLGFAGWLWLLLRTPSRLRAGLIGWWFGLGYFVIGLYWIAIAFFSDAEKFGALALPAVLLLCAVMAIFPAIAGLLVGALRPGRPLAAAIALALAWTVAEWLRAHFLWGFPWNLIGYVWIGVLPVSQVAAFVGIYGLSLLTVLSAALFVTLIERRDRTAWVGPAIAVGLLTVLFLGGALRLQGPETGHHPGIHLRLVQANIDQHHKWDPELRAESFRRHLDLTAGQPVPSSAPDATHVIWPETASAYVLDDDVVARDMVGDLTPKDGYLITGFNRFDLISKPKRAWNSLAVIDAGGSIRAGYDKHRLVPFGEFLPWRAVLSRIGLQKITEGTIDFQPGGGAKTLALAGLPPFSPLICYEAIFTGEVVDPDDRPAWILNITNDAWFGQSSGPYQHLAMARMRAIEEGLPLVRSANTGISAIVDPYGRIEAELGLGGTGVLDHPLPLPLAAPTFYAKWRQIGFLSIVAFGVFMIFMIEKVLKNRYVKFM
ncbi:MAG: apolipoprotein N-acyltransferase [Geminicoccaceae bacterium]